MRSKDYMKSGEIRKGDSLHFDGIGYDTRPPVDHLKVNKWMLKQGFVWESHSNSTKGLWVQPDGDSDPVNQDEAVAMWEARRRWWQIK